MISDCIDTISQFLPSKEQLLLCIILWILCKLIYNELFSPLAKMPGIRPSTLSMYVFSYARLRKRQDRLLHQLHERYGPIVRIGPAYVSVSDPSLLNIVYNTPQFQKSKTYDAFNKGADSIFSTRNPERHKFLRRLITPSFSLNYLHSVEPVIIDTGIKHLVKRVETCAEFGKIFDIMAYFHHMSIDVIGAVSFGGSFGLQTGNDPSIVQWLADAARMGMLRASLSSICLPFVLRKYLKSHRKLVKFVRNVIDARRASNERRNDVLQRLLDAIDSKTGAPLSNVELVTESITHLIGGTETTAITLTWTMYHLMKNPECMEKLYNELKEAFPDRNKMLTYADVKDLPYLDSVLHESLRISPSTSAGSEREIPKGGAMIGGYYIPEGTIITASMLAIHYNKDLFPEPDRFIPERWLTNPNRVAEMKHCLLTFSMGPRVCSGRSLAWIELRLALASLIRRFSFHVPAGAETDMTPEVQFLTRPRDNKLLVMATRRAE